jgi:hypothetical protein
VREPEPEPPNPAAVVRDIAPGSEGAGTAAVKAAKRGRKTAETPQRGPVVAPVMSWWMQRESTNRHSRLRALRLLKNGKLP